MIRLLAKEYGVNLAVGNVDPKMKTSVANNVPIPGQVKCVSTIVFFIKKAMPFYSYLKSSKLMYIYGRKRKPFASHCLAVLSVYLSDNLAVKYE